MLLSAAPSLLHGDSSSRFFKLKIKEKAFEDALLKDSDLMGGLIDVREIDGRKYLISVGACALSPDAVPGSVKYNPEKLVKAIGYAETMAKAKLARLIKLTMSAKETFSSSYEEVTKIDSEGKELRIRRVKEIFTSYSKSKSLEHILSIDQKEIGWWITSDKQWLYKGIAYPLN